MHISHFKMTTKKERKKLDMSQMSWSEKVDTPAPQ